MKRIAALVVTVALIAPASAFARGSSTCQAYNPQTCNLSRATSTSSLPFTGGEFVLMSTAGLAALGGGSALIVLSRRRRSS